MDYVTTNIRIPEEDYLKLKAEAARKRKSFAAVIREKISGTDSSRSDEDVKKILEDLDRLANRNSKKLKGFDSLKALREMRYENKW